MAIEGPLKELGIHDVFQLLDVSRKTGVLRIASRLRNNQGTVYFRDGAVIYAEIRSNPHRLGELLIRAGTITPADLSRACDIQRQGDKRRVGEILVAIDAVSSAELEKHVAAQVEEVVFELMSWQEGYFSFQEGLPQDFAAGAIVRVPTEALLMEAARRIDEWSRIEARIPNLAMVPRFAAPEEAGHGQLDLLAEEWEVLAAIDGTASVRDIAALLERSEFDVAKTLFGLASAGVITLEDGAVRPALAAGERPDVSDMLERAERALAAGDVATARALAEEIINVDPHEPAAHLLLGSAAVAQRRDSEAEEHLRRALRFDPMLLDAHRLLGDALARQGRFGEAAEWWQRWLRICADIPNLGDQADQVQAALHAARTLDTLLRVPHA
jgi:tetratricopeptide (TPR) repeat protein